MKVVNVVDQNAIYQNRVKSNKKNNNQAFGVGFRKNKSASKIAQFWFSEDDLSKLMPEILDMRTTNGGRIKFSMFGRPNKNKLKIIGTAGKNKAIAWLSGRFGGSTVRPEDILASQAKNLVLNLKYIQDKLNKKIGTVLDKKLKLETC